MISSSCVPLSSIFCDLIVAPEYLADTLAGRIPLPPDVGGDVGLGVAVFPVADPPVFVDPEPVFVVVPVVVEPRLPIR